MATVSQAVFLAAKVVQLTRMYRQNEKVFRELHDDVEKYGLYLKEKWGRADSVDEDLMELSVEEDVALGELGAVLERVMRRLKLFHGRPRPVKFALAAALQRDVEDLRKSIARAWDNVTLASLRKELHRRVTRQDKRIQRLLQGHSTWAADTEERGMNTIVMDHIAQGASEWDARMVRFATDDWARPIDRGGQGAVFEGRAGNYSFAVKVDREGLLAEADDTTSDSSRQRRTGSQPRGELLLLREGRIIESLKHPYVVELLGTCSELGLTCLVMKYARGGNLMRRLGVAHKAADRAVETGEKHLPWLSWEARLRIAAQLACVIRDLHARGVLHHDLKPENMLLDSCGTAPSIRLTDFGVAKRAPRPTAPGSAFLQANATTMMGAGTFGYKDPSYRHEAGVAYAPHHDIYSTGAILLQLVTGLDVFESKRLVSTPERPRMRREIPDPRAAWPDWLWRRIVALACRCLVEVDEAGAPKEAGVPRRPTAAELADELERLAAIAEIKVHRRALVTDEVEDVKQPALAVFVRNRMLGAAAVACLTVVGLAGVAWLLRHTVAGQRALGAGQFAMSYAYSAGLSMQPSWRAPRITRRQVLAAVLLAAGAWALHWALQPPSVVRVEDEEGLRKALRTPSTMAVDLHGAEVVLKEVVIVDRKIAIRNGTLKAARSKVGNGFALRVVQGGDLLLDHVQLTKSGLWVWEGSAAELSGCVVQRAPHLGICTVGAGSRCAVRGGSVQSSGESGVGAALGAHVELSAVQIERAASFGIECYDSGSQVAVSLGTVAHAGDSGVHCERGGRVTLSGTVLADCARWGVYTVGRQSVVVQDSVTFARCGKGVTRTVR